VLAAAATINGTGRWEEQGRSDRAFGASGIILDENGWSGTEEVGLLNEMLRCTNTARLSEWAIR
jgi:hypothetical protein